jgi:predicted MFS family arabinose efflux permease
MKNLLVLMLVTVSLSAGCTALKVASQVAALGVTSVGQVGIQKVPKIAPANIAKQTAAINAATKVANQAGAVNAGMIPSHLLRLIP